MATNIREIQLKYSNQQKCLNLLEKLRWGKTVTCPYCDKNKIRTVDALKKRHFCKSCKEQFSVFTDTIFEGTLLELPICNEFEKFLKNALKHDKALHNWKAESTQQVKEVVYG